MTIPKKLIYDLTWSTPELLKPSEVAPHCVRAFWISPGHLWPWGDDGFKPTIERMRVVAESFRDGTPLDIGHAALHPKDPNAEHNYVKIHPSTFVCFDFEPILTPDNSDHIAELCDAFREVAPGIRTSMYGGIPPSVFGTIEQYLNQSADDKKVYAAAWKKVKKLAHTLDVISVAWYLLGPAYVERDLAAFAQLMRDTKKHYPGKTIYVFVWGAYNTAYNPPNSVFTDEITHRYVKTALDHGAEGFLVWGEYRDNVKLINEIAKLTNT